MRWFINFTLILLISPIAALAQAEAKRVLPLPACGGYIEVERTDLQTLIAIKDVEKCPYVIFKDERRSLQLTVDGRYEMFYVWHEAAAEGHLQVILHTATGDLRDAVDIIESAGLTARRSPKNIAPKLWARL